MAITLFNGGESWYPFYPQQFAVAFDTSSLVIDASGEVVVLVVRVPKTGTIDRFGAIIHAVGNTPDNGLRFSLQSVSATTGLQTGIIEGGNAFATVASGSVATGFLDPGAFAASHAVTRGDLLAFVIDIPTFTASDSVTVRGVTVTGGSNQFPYSIRATNTITGALLPIIVAHYTDSGGSWESLDPSIYAADAGPTDISYDTGTTPDELGAVFIPSQPCRLNRILVPIGTDASGANFDLIVYDSANNVLDTVSIDGNQVALPTSSLTRYVNHLLAAPLTLTAGETYRFITKATTANNIRMNYLSIPSTLINTLPGKLVNLYLTARTDAGSWTNYNNGTDGYRYPMLVLGFDGFEDGFAARPRHQVGLI